MLTRHATDIVSLIFGTIFAGFTVVWLLKVTDLIDFEQAWISGPVVLIIAGVLGLAMALRPRDTSKVPGPPDPGASA